MSDRHRRLAASRAEIERLAGQPISEVTPSRRDFAQYIATQRSELAVIARLSRASAADTAALIALAQECDDAEVAALAVVSQEDELSAEDMRAIADATTAPVLRDALILDPSQLYFSRLYGADAVVVAASELDRAALTELLAVARSLHMATVVEVLDAATLDAAIQLPHAIIGIGCATATGDLDVAAAHALAAQVPRQRTLIVLPEVTSAAECAQLRGVCDVIVVGEILRNAGDIAACLRRFVG